MSRFIVALLCCLIVIVPVLAQSSGPIYLPLLEKPAATPTPAPTPEPLPTAVPPAPPSKFCQQHPVKTVAPNYPVYISAINMLDEYVDLYNASTQPVDLTGWHLCSVNGNEEMIIPAFTLDAATTLTVSNNGRPRVWQPSETEAGALFDSKGTLIAYLTCTDETLCFYGP